MVIRQSKNSKIKECRHQVLQASGVKHIIKQAQSIMLTLSSSLHDAAFDNSVAEHDCIDRLVSHRIKTKFHIDDSSRTSVLQKEAFEKYITYDNSLSADIDLWSSLKLRQARINLHKWFKGFKIDLLAARYQPTPGETYLSSQGEVSITAKLFSKDHWTTTANCLEDTCIFIYNNSSFKRAAVYHIRQVGVTRKESRKLYMRFRHKADVGYHVFRELLISRVLTIFDGARASSVPKSNEQRRFINVEAMFPVILQRIVSSAILKRLKRAGNNLSNHLVRVKDTWNCIKISAQKLHGLMIRSSRYSTIDFSNASDSVTNAAVRSLFPKEVSDLLFKYRSQYVVFDDKFHSPQKLSSMGNGFTFEVMTSLLYAVAKTYSDDVRVYGDDVIIPNEFASSFIETCAVMDFRVNEKKTFINSFFRESCGYFYSDHINAYITSFDFNQIISLSDVIITSNKLTIILEAGQISSDLWCKLDDARNRLNALVHASRKGPLPETEYQQRQNMAMYIFDRNYVKKAKRSKDLSVLRKHYIVKNSEWFSMCKLESSDFALVFIPFFVPHRSKLLYLDCKGLDTLLPALYSGSRLTAAVRGKGRWVDLPAFVDTDGTVTLLSNLISQNKHNVWVDRLNGVMTSHERK